MTQAAIFDLGGVLIDWDPRHLYRKLFSDDQEMEYFLTNICTPEWNHRQDEGRSWDLAISELAQKNPEHLTLIESYWYRWPEMLGGALEETVGLVAELKANGIGLYALSNWSAETFPIAKEKFEFLSWFDGLVISGDLGIAKPDERIYTLCLKQHNLAPSDVVFVDDQPRNIETAQRLGIEAHLYTDPDPLRFFLSQRGLI